MGGKDLFTLLTDIRVMSEERTIDIDVSGETKAQPAVGGRERFAGLKKGLAIFRIVKLVVVLVIVVGLVSHVFLVYRAASSLEYMGGGVGSLESTTSPYEYKAVILLELKNPTTTAIDIDRLTYSIYVEDEFVGSGQKGAFSVRPGLDEYDFEVEFSITDMSEATRVLFLQENATLIITGEASVPLKIFGVYRLSSITVPYTIEEPVDITGGEKPVPPAPVLLYPPGREPFSTNVRLEWSQSLSEDFSRYEVHMSEENMFTPSNITLVDNITEIDRTTYVFDDLEAGKTYYFRIRVVDATGLYSDSNQQSFQLLPI